MKKNKNPKCEPLYLQLGYIEYKFLISVCFGIYIGIPRPDITWSWQPCDYDNKCEINAESWTKIPENHKYVTYQCVVCSTNLSNN